jgi:hypothetical protein
MDEKNTHSMFFLLGDLEGKNHNHGRENFVPGSCHAAGNFRLPQGFEKRWRGEKILFPVGFIFVFRL